MPDQSRPLLPPEHVEQLPNVEHLKLFLIINIGSFFQVGWIFTDLLSEDTRIGTVRYTRNKVNWEEDEHLTNYVVSSEIIIINQWICVTCLGFILSECRGVHHGWALPEPTSQRVSAFPGWPFWIQVFHSGSNRYAASSSVQDLLLLLLFGYPVW